MTALNFMPVSLLFIHTELFPLLLQPAWENIRGCGVFVKNVFNRLFSLTRSRLYLIVALLYAGPHGKAQSDSGLYIIVLT